MNTIISRLSKNISDGQCLLCNLGQHSFIVKLGGTIVYLDPFVTHLSGRLLPPPLEADEITNADIVTGSHDHGDHIDRPSWPAIATASPQAVFIVPKAVKPSIREVPSNRMKGLNAGESITIRDVTVTAVPAAHELLDKDQKTGLYPYLGYIVQGNGVTIYHSGDTCIYEGMAKLLRKWKIDIALLPINGRDAKRLRRNCIGNMTFQEAVDLAGAIRPKMAIPAHFDMFRGNTEDPRKFIDYLKIKYPDIACARPPRGKVVHISF